MRQHKNIKPTVLKKNLKSNANYNREADINTVNEVKEPAVAYSFSSIQNILGGSKFINLPLSNEMDMVLLARQGIKKQSMLHVADILNISVEKMSNLVGVSHRNFQRKKNHDTLNVPVSEQTIEIAQVIAKGVAVFGSQDRFLGWLNSPIVALGNKMPMDLLDTTFGIQILVRILGRIEYGVYS